MEVKLPKLGESILSAKIVQWFKQEGESVELDEPLLEVSTDKVNSEIPAPAAGVITKILAQVDEELDVGATLCLIGEESESTPAAAEKTVETPKVQDPDSEGILTPVVLRIASQKGLSIDELKKIPGTGSGGRITKRDLEAYLAKKPEAKPAAAAGDDIEHIKMSTMRKAIAESMVRSFYQAPHATLVAEIDVTKVQKHIKSVKESFLNAHGYKLTVTSFIAQAISAALHEYPLLNSSLSDDTIVLKRTVNLGIAVSVENGIMVPVIKGCHRMSLPEIAKEVALLSEKARTESLKPTDVQGSTITMTNFGMSGISMGIPIIHYPEVSIVGIGAISRKVVALDDETMAIRSMMNVSLTFDHRVIDGMYGCGFLKALKDHLENPPQI